jgi:histidinol dehydrogenase
MPSSPPAGPSANRVAPSIDHTRWIAGVVEIVAIAGAVALAYLHTGA